LFNELAVQLICLIAGFIPAAYYVKSKWIKGGSDLKIALATAERYVRLDIKYKFQYLTDVAIIAGNFIGFGIMGFFMQAKGGVLPQGYTFAKYMLVGTYMRVIFTKIYDDCTKVLSEEASWGTLPLLLVSNVSIPLIVIGRALASTVKYGVITSVIGLPVLHLVDALHIKINYIPLAILCLASMWLFIIGLSAIINSMILIFKKIGMLPLSVMESLMFAVGFYFPIELFPQALWPILGSIPYAIGLQIVRDLMILGYPRESITALYPSLQSGIFKMLIGLGVFLAFSFGMLILITRKSQKWGTIEQY